MTSRMPAEPAHGNGVHSMTGFSSVEGEAGGQRLRLELKALNHRFLDLKVRVPRELSSYEVPLRASLQASFSRGAIDLKIERAGEAAAIGTNTVQTNLALAAHYYESLITLQKTLGLNDAIRTIDLAQMPEVITRGGHDSAAPASDQTAWADLERLLKQGMAKLEEMRRHEGEAIGAVLRHALDEMQTGIGHLREARAACETQYRAKFHEKITAVFEAHPLPAGASVQAVLESRIAQELAMLIDRTDVEEELTRFRAHLDHFRKTLDGGGPVGRKLDFILQELHREINTLGNKAQDFGISEDVVQIKVRLEQLREQVMNLE
jgi:uncharacterized protein (TIGR00255 family)